MLDFCHAFEHIAKAVETLHGSDARRKSEVLASQRKALLEDNDGVNQVICALKPSQKLLRGNRKAELTREMRYLEKHASMMGYAELKRRGPPIGSGLQEAACKTVVAQRMKRSGMTWRETGGQAILTLRSLQKSNRLDAAWTVLKPHLVQAYTLDPNPARKRPLRQTL